MSNSALNSSPRDRGARLDGVLWGPSGRSEPAERRWLAWSRSVVAAGIVVVLVGLGIANIAMRARWHEVEDGVLWAARSEGVTAVEIVPGSPADLAGIRVGDVLLAVDGATVETPAD